MFTRHNINHDWIGMMAALAFAGAALSAPGVSMGMDAPAAPTNALSAMWTLENIYNVLDTRTTNVIKRAGAAAFAEPAGLPTNGTMHTLNDIMTLVTNRASVKKTGQTATTPLNPSPTGSDGDLRMGVAWPNPRFTTNSVGTTNDIVIRDNLTGLLWTKNAKLSIQTNWIAAIDFCNSLNAANYGGYSTGWRLPNVSELQSLIDYGNMTPALPSGHLFSPGPGSDVYWTSTSTSDTGAYKVSLNTVDLYGEAKTTVLYVWPVRGGGD